MPRTITRVWQASRSLQPDPIRASATRWEERHGPGLCTYPRCRWCFVYLPRSAVRGRTISHTTEPDGLLSHGGFRSLRKSGLVRGVRFRGRIAPRTRTVAGVLPKGLQPLTGYADPGRRDGGANSLSGGAKTASRTPSLSPPPRKG